MPAASTSPAASTTTPLFTVKLIGTAEPEDNPFLNDGFHDRWWELPEEEVRERLLAHPWSVKKAPGGVIASYRQAPGSSVWTTICESPLARTHELLALLLRHHPSLLTVVLDGPHGANLRDLAWKDGRDAPRRSLLAHALTMCHQDVVVDLLQRGATLNANEQGREGSLALAVIVTSRNLPEDSPLHRLTPDERRARETALLAAVNALPLPEAPDGAPAGTVAMPGPDLLNDRPRLATELLRLHGVSTIERTIEGLVEHGVNVREVLRSVKPIKVRELVGERDPVAEGNLSAEGNAVRLDTWLRLGVAWSQGPGDDTTALNVLARVERHQSAVMGRPSEDPQNWAQRQVALLDVLAAHGWTPGPVFKARALHASVAAGGPSEIWPALIERGASMTLPGAHGRTLLHTAMTGVRATALVPALLDQGLDAQALDHDGLTPIEQGRRQVEADTTRHPRQAARIATVYGAAIATLEGHLLRTSWPEEGPDANVQTLPSSRRGRARL